MRGGSVTGLPFEVTSRHKGTWRSRWRERQLMIAVAGGEDAPSASHMATLRDVVASWADYQQIVTTFVRGLASGEHVPLTPATLGGFAAKTCGFDEELAFLSIEVTDASAPQRVRVTFCTGLPDGYATYAVVLDAGVPVEISAFAS
jgi:hypothetical protein